MNEGACPFKSYVTVVSREEGVAGLWNVREEWRSARYFEQSLLPFLALTGNATQRLNPG